MPCAKRELPSMKTRARNLYKARYGKYPEGDSRNKKAKFYSKTLDLEVQLRRVVDSFDLTAKQVADLLTKLATDYSRTALEEYVNSMFPSEYSLRLIGMDFAEAESILFRHEARVNYQIQSRSVRPSPYNRLTLAEYVQRSNLVDSVLLSAEEEAEVRRQFFALQPAPTGVEPVRNPTNPNDHQSSPSYFNPDGNIRGYRRS